MGRIYLKRIAMLGFLVVVIYFAARSLSWQGNQIRNKWFFEYIDASASSWQPNDDAVVFKRISINTEEQKANGPTIIPVLTNGVVPNEQILQTKKCPVCFGTDLCEHIKSGILELDLSQMLLTPGKPRKIAYNGALHTSNTVIVKTIILSEFSLLDQYMCLKSNAKSDCDSSKEANSLIRTGDAKKLLLIEEIKQLHKHVKKTRGDLPIAICTNNKLLSLLKKAFHESKDGEITGAEQIMLYSTLASNPELVVLKFLTKFFPSLPFPQYYGSCGRVYVVEGGITPLRDHLNEPFNVRASLGAQLLQMIDDFVADEDSEWFVMFTDISFDNLGVNKDGEVVILDVEEMVLVDKAILKEESETVEKLQKNISQEPCNEHCLALFTQQVMHSATSGESACVSIPHYSGHLMYALVCQRILSYMEEHQVEDFFNADPYKKARPSAFQGLLHGTPSKDKGALDELLQECVQETAAGGRIQAAEELKDYLSEFFKDDDDNEGEDEKNNADEYEINGGGQKLGKSILLDSNSILDLKDPYLKIRKLKT